MKGAIIFVDRPKLGALLHSDPPPPLHYTNNHHSDDHDNHNCDHDDDSSKHRPSNASCATSPYLMSPYNNNNSNHGMIMSTSPFNKSPWLLPSTPPVSYNLYGAAAVEDGLVGSITREEGHIYSLAVRGDLLYTGSDSKNIRVWKKLKDFAAFKSSSGLVKAIIISGGKIFTGHQDGKIRIWKVPHTNPTIHRRIGTLPTLTDNVKSAFSPENKSKHYDAVSCLSLDEENGLLYSGSWDKTVKVWSVSDSKCLQSIDAHADAVNAVVAAFGCHVFTGSADGTVKMWRRESGTCERRRAMTHVLDGVLLAQESAVTALAVNRWSRVVYGGSSDGAVNFWGGRRSKGKILFSHDGALRGHNLAVLCVAVAGSLVVSGSADNSVSAWKREEGSGTHMCLSVLNGHAGPVKCIAAIEEEEISEDETGDDLFHHHHRHHPPQLWMVYTGSLDKSVKVWRVSEKAPELSAVQGWALHQDAGVAKEKVSPLPSGRISFSDKIY